LLFFLILYCLSKTLFACSVQPLGVQTLCALRALNAKYTTFQNTEGVIKL